MSDRFVRSERNNSWQSNLVLPFTQLFCISQSDLLVFLSLSSMEEDIILCVLLLIQSWLFFCSSRVHCASPPSLSGSVSARVALLVLRLYVVIVNLGFRWLMAVRFCGWGPVGLSWVDFWLIWRICLRYINEAELSEAELAAKQAAVEAAHKEAEKA